MLAVWVANVTLSVMRCMMADMTYLVATIQKRPLLATLRRWREETENQVEAALLGEIIAEVESGFYDG
jgi:hypothetical protein